MKKKYMALLGTFLALAAAPAIAQDNYYHFNMSPATPTPPSFDHGEANMVLPIANGHYIMVGDVFDTPLVPAPPQPGLFIAEYDAAGVPVWTKVYWSMLQAATFVGGAVTPIANGYAISGDFQTGLTHNGILIVTDNAGALVAEKTVSNGPATDVAYDPINKRIAVLSASTGANFSNFAFHLTIYDEATLNVLFSNKYKAGPSLMDTPCRMEFTGNGYTLVGTTYNFQHHDVMVVRTDASANLLCTTTYGRADRDEYGISSLGDMICAQSVQYINNLPFYTPLAINTLPCSVNYTAALLTPATGSNPATAITYNGTDFVFSGVNNVGGGTNGFVLTFDAAFTTAAAQVFGQPLQPGNEEFHDIIAAGNKLVMCGSHQKLGAWPPGTVGGLNYPWLVVANNSGVGSCSENLDVSITPYELTVKQAMISNPDQVYPDPDFHPAEADQDYLDECSNPHRFTPEAAAPLRLYPNPANDVLNIDLGSFDPACNLRVEIRNVSGQLVLTENAAGGKPFRLSLAGLAAGMYTCTLSDNAQLIRREKLVVQH